jgi:hypothetical protein
MPLFIKVFSPRAVLAFRREELGDVTDIPAMLSRNSYEN